jgi:hypothetical protein
MKYSIRGWDSTVTFLRKASYLEYHSVRMYCNFVKCYKTETNAFYTLDKIFMKLIV